ncbi:protein of unknown function [Rhodovastum atsumiense]|nr:protein of unknown function [Rhodovastum atsumiense]
MAVCPDPVLSFFPDPGGEFISMPDTIAATQVAALRRPLTAAVQRALSHFRDESSASDLLFLERWEITPMPGAAAALRVGQLRRANPGLVAEIRAELARGRPLTAPERDALPPVSAARTARLRPVA